MEPCAELPVCISTLMPSAMHGQGEHLSWKAGMLRAGGSSVLTWQNKEKLTQSAAQLMHVDGLTRENVASHLQKYRLQLKKENKLDDEGNLISGAGRDSGEPASSFSHDEEPGVRCSPILPRISRNCWNACHSQGCAQSPVFSRVLHEGAWKDGRSELLTPLWCASRRLLPVRSKKVHPGLVQCMIS